MNGNEATSGGGLENSLENSKDERELKQLLTEACAGSRESYKMLLRRIEELLRPFVKNRLTRAGQGGLGTEEDVLQEILLGIHTKRDLFDPSHPFLPWMYAVARYKAIDYLRSARVRGGTISMDDPESSFSELAAKEEDPGNRLDVRTLLSHLPTKQRELLQMVKIDGLSVQEASLKSGFSPSDVRVSIHRGIKALRKLLEGAAR